MANSRPRSMSNGARRRAGCPPGRRPTRARPRRPAPMATLRPRCDTQPSARRGGALRADEGEERDGHERDGRGERGAPWHPRTRPSAATAPAHGRERQGEARFEVTTRAGGGPSCGDDGRHRPGRSGRTAARARCGGPPRPARARWPPLPGRRRARSDRWCRCARAAGGQVLATMAPPTPTRAAATGATGSSTPHRRQEEPGGADRDHQRRLRVGALDGLDAVHERQRDERGDHRVGDGAAGELGPDADQRARPPRRPGARLAPPTPTPWPARPGTR